MAKGPFLIQWRVAHAGSSAALLMAVAPEQDAGRETVVVALQVASGQTTYKQ